jgi:hypothetical protein
MEPVVNGLEETYGDKLDMRWLDANSADGGAAFRYYQLFGHPSYVILNPEGLVLWNGLGELSESELGQQITAVLTEP